MRQTSDQMYATWRAGDYTGDKRPIARVTVQHPEMLLKHKALRSTSRRVTPSTSGIKDTTLSGAVYGSTDVKHGERIDETYANYLFNPEHRPIELPNVKSVHWERSLDADTATCTVELFNTQPLPIGQTPVKGELDRPGWFTYNRGGAAFSSRWKHARNEWYGMLMPDNLIRTYEGYGWDASKSPENDDNLMLTGVWSIDSVVMTHDGTLTLNCRDMGKLLVEQICWAPVIPSQFYPLTFMNWDEKVFIGYNDPDKQQVKITSITSSNSVWIGNDPIAGHKLTDGTDGDPSTYWLSVGNIHPSKRYAYEYLEAYVSGATVSELRFRTKKSGYTAYAAVEVGGVWQGKTLIDYHEDGVGRNGANTIYVKSTHVSDEGEHRITFDPIENVTRVRLVLGHLQDFGFGPYRYRGGIRELKVYGLSGTKKEQFGKLTRGPAGANPGRYGDYTEIVKLLCAWGGFYWPKTGYWLDSDGSKRHLAPTTNDSSVLGHGITGRVWGDFMQSGTAGPEQITADTFDKKTLMEGISAIRDILGFVFFIDETGGAVWRMPNIFNRGNWLVDSPKPGRTRQMWSIDERKILMSLNAQISSANVREGIFVGNPGAHKAALVPGYNPNPTGLRRILGWTDQNFKSEKESELMGEMIALRQLFSYRADAIQIPGFPGIQIDDQVRIFERTTSEGFIHYVQGISSSLDMQAGTWTYDLSTHWLGNDPKTSWVFDVESMSSSAKQYVQAVSDSPAGLRRGHP